MIRRPPENRSSEAGFALIEVLVALALLALAIALMPGALRLGTSAWEARSELDRASREGLALTLVERRIAEAMATYERDETGGIRIAFVGTEQALSFIAAGTSGPAGGGVYRHRLAASDPTGSGLSLAVSLYRPADPAPAPPGTAETRILVPPPAQVKFRYFGALAPGSSPQWHEAWSRADAFPALVEITLTTPAGKRRSVVAPRLEIRPQ
jgi:prepilin-type N-terminal cleavage/methylation domain-containing protein